MSTNSSPNQGGAKGQRVEDVMGEAMARLRDAITYFNDAVVPQVRRESIQGLRTAADALRNLADRFEQQAGAAPGAGNPSADDGPPKPSGEPRS